MKPTDTYWEVNKEGDVICVFHGDNHRRTITVNATDLPAPSWKIAQLMNDAFNSGVKEMEDAFNNKTTKTPYAYEWVTPNANGTWTGHFGYEPPTSAVGYKNLTPLYKD